MLFATLVARWTPGLRRYAQALVGNAAVADEVVQDCWLGFVRGLPGFAFQSALSTWTWRILFHQATTRRRKEDRSVPLSALLDDGDDVDAERFDPGGHWSVAISAWRPPAGDEAVARTQLQDAVRDAVSTLPSKQRLVLEWIDLDGVDPTIVCNTLEITATHQRVLLHRARAAVRLKLEHRFGKAS